VKPLSGTPLYGKLLALPTNIRLERLARDKHSSLLRKLVNYGRKKLYNIGPRPDINTANIPPDWHDDHNKCNNSFNFIEHRHSNDNNIHSDNIIIIDNYYYDNKNNKSNNNNISYDSLNDSSDNNNKTNNNNKTKHI